MNHDDKSARARRGAPPSRSTAPAGTPYPVAPPSPAPVVPAPTASQPRTLGGHTARLVVAEEEARAFDSFASSSVPVVVHDGPPISPPPMPRAVAGTVRLDAASAPASPVPFPVPIAPPTAAKQDSPEQRPVAQVESQPKGAPPATTVRTPWTEAPASSRPVTTSGEEDGASFFARLFAPVSVAVGLVFFAMGCMIALTAEGRLIQFSITTGVVPTAPHSAPTVDAPTAAPPTAVVSAVVGVPTAVPEPSAKPSAVPGVRPAGRDGGKAAVPLGQTSKRPPLPFP